MEQEELRFWEVFVLDEVNILDAEIWLHKDKLAGLVDEESGGIIGYIHKEHIDKILKLLNK